jgi:hypothetical protein
MRNSTIKIKKCKCSEDCDKYPTMGYAGYYYSHAPDVIKEKISELRESKLAQKKIRQLEYVSKAKRNIPEKIEKPFKLRSELLAIADSSFSRYIRKRDSDEKGFIKCICCKNRFSLLDKDDDNMPIVQALHFLKRGTYTRRFDENWVYAGCSRCNQKMHFDPQGKEYIAYRKFLCDKFGEDVVNEVEKEVRTVNKISESEIRDIILKYKSCKLK